jgi:hypothetical protein
VEATTVPLARPTTTTPRAPDADPVTLLIVADGATARATTAALAASTARPPHVTHVRAPDLDALVGRAGRIGVVDPSRWRAWREPGPLTCRPLRGADRLALLRRLRERSALVSWLGDTAQVERAIAGRPAGTGQPSR